MERANWIDERAKVLLDESAPDEALGRASTDLRGIIHGMGGLLDLTVRGGPQRKEDNARARRELDGLAEDLDRLTNPRSQVE